MRKILVTLLLLTLSASLRAEDRAALLARLQQMDSQTRLDNTGLKPWHMKISYQLMDDKGKPAEAGNMEEWWLGPKQYKVAYVSPSFTETILVSPDGVYRSTPNLPAPYLNDLILQSFVRPVGAAEDQEKGATPMFFSQDIFKIKMDCVMLSQPMQWPARTVQDIHFIEELDRNAPLGLFPSYCTTKQTGKLMLSYDYGNEAAIRNQQGEFQGQSVAIQISIVAGNKLIATAKLETLTGANLTDADFAVPPDFKAASSRQVDMTGSKIAGAVLQGRLISQPVPIYPETAKERRISGKVVLKGTIGIDGQIHALKIINYPDPSLAISAIQAVRYYKYKPYTLNGEPVAVDTTINVMYELN